MNGDVRDPLVEGIFYPRKKEELGKLLETMRESLPTRAAGVPREPGKTETTETRTASEEVNRRLTAEGLQSNLLGLLLPHAAYEYIFPLLHAGFSALLASRESRNRLKMEESPPTFILAAGLHREKRSGIFLPPFAAFASAAGNPPVAGELVRQILEEVGEAELDEAAFLEEHSFDVLFPPIAHFFPQSPVIPILCGDIDRKTVRAFEKAMMVIEEKLIGEGETPVPAPSTPFTIISSNVTAETDPANAPRRRKAFESALLGSSGGQSSGQNSDKGSGQGTQDPAGRLRASRPTAPTPSRPTARQPRAERLLESARDGSITACGAAAVAGFLSAHPESEIFCLGAGSSQSGEDTREVGFAAYAFLTGHGDRETEKNERGGER